MGHSEDDAVPKLPHKMKMHWQNQLKNLALDLLKLEIRIRNKNIDVIFAQCPFNNAKSHILFNCSSSILLSK